MIFAKIESDLIIQVKDKFRISAEKSFKTPDEGAWIKAEIEPFAGAGFIDVTGNLAKPNPEKYWFLDFQYETDGVQTISMRLTSDVSTVTETLDVEAITEAADNLFSNDGLLKEIQEDIYKLLPDGRSSMKYKHRAAQKSILDWLWNNGYYKRNSAIGGVTPFLKADIIDIDFISDWATYVCLRMLFESNQSQGGDIFRTKASDFMNKEERAREKCLLALDIDNDGAISINEGVQVTSRKLIRV